MRILGHDIQPISGEIVSKFGLSSVSLDQLLGESDFVTLHTDLNPTSFHLMSAARLDLLKQTAVLVNTSRGSVIDEPALVSALRAGRLGGAALDVFEEEPLPNESPLRELSNVYLAPHTANSSQAAVDRVHANTIRNLLHVLGAVQA